MLRITIYWILFLSSVFPQLLENHIKKELTENSQLVQAIPSHEQNKLPSYEPRRSASVACGSSVFEVCLRVPTWASLVKFFLSRGLCQLYLSKIKFHVCWFWPIKWFSWKFFLLFVNIISLPTWMNFVMTEKMMYEYTRCYTGIQWIE
jgi:hypothetical protein